MEEEFKRKLFQHFQLKSREIQLTYDDWISKRESDWKRVITKSRPQLTIAIPTDVRFYDLLTSRGVFSKRHLENFRLQHGRCAQISALLDGLSKRPFDDFVKFCSVLMEMEQAHIIVDWMTPELQQVERRVRPATADEMDAIPGLQDNSNDEVDFNWKLAMRLNFSDLVDVVDPDNGLLLGLRAKGVLSDYNIDLFESEKGRTRRAAKLLDYIMLKRPARDFVKLRQTLNEVGQGDIVTKYLSKEGLLRAQNRDRFDGPATLERIRQSLAEEPLNTVRVDWKKILLKNHLILVEEMSVKDDLVTELMKLGVINLQFNETLKEEKNIFDRASQLLDYMQRRSDKDYVLLRQALETVGQSHITKDYLIIDPPVERTSQQVSEQRDPMEIQAGAAVFCPPGRHFAPLVDEQETSVKGFIGPDATMASRTHSVTEEPVPVDAENLTPAYQPSDADVPEPVKDVTNITVRLSDAEHFTPVYQPTDANVPEHTNDVTNPSQSANCQINPAGLVDGQTNNARCPYASIDSAIGNSIVDTPADVVTEVPHPPPPPPPPLSPTVADVGQRIEGVHLAKPLPMFTATSGPVAVEAVRVKACERNFYESYKSHAYPVSKALRGKCIIFNMEKVGTYARRAGTRVDGQLLKDLFAQLHFIVVEFIDLSAEEVKSQLARISSDPTLQNDQCLVMFFMSHGTLKEINNRRMDCIFGSDGQHLTTDEILLPFSDAQCNFLKNKPKLFFFQACRGEHFDQTDATLEPMTETDHTRDAPSYPDFLIGYPTQSSYRSFRNTERGSWYINALVRIFMEYACQMDVCAMLNALNGQVSKWCSDTGEPTTSNKTQIANYVSHFRQPYFFFFPGIINDDPHTC